jgi:hypothetical protein
VTSKPRYVATRLWGDGTETVLDGDLQVNSFEESRVLNNGAEITARLAPKFQYLYLEDGSLMLQRWATGIYAIIGGDVVGGILVDYDENKGGELELDIMGFAGWPNGQPYTDSWVATHIDPIDVFRQGWDWIQSKDRSNLGLQLDDTKAGYTIGRMVAQGEFDTENGPLSFEYEPVRFAWYETDDLGGKLAELAANTPFDFTELHSFNEELQTFTHRLAIGYPRLGRRRHDLRFVIGENVDIDGMPGSGDNYASEVMALGAGEGSAMVRAHVHRNNESRLRRVHVLDVKDAQTPQAANAAAQGELIKHHGESTLNEVIAYPGDPDAAAVVVGDEIRVQGDTGHRVIDLWARVIKITREHPGDGAIRFDVSADDTLGA